MKLKLVRPKMSGDFRRGENICHDTHLCPQHAGLKKWMADNVRLGVPHLNARYPSPNVIRCGPMRRVT